MLKITGPDDKNFSGAPDDVAGDLPSAERPANESPAPEAGQDPEAVARAEEIVSKRVEAYTHGANFAWVTSTLVARRDEILERWLDVAASQPFHHGRREHAVADHIPALFDALTSLLRTTTPRWVEAYAPLEDVAVLTAAQNHARTRAEQGLRPAEVVVEFRLLRQEIWLALRSSIPNSAPTEDIVAAELLVNDALDGAITQGLAALNDQIEQVREEFLAITLHDVRQPLTSISGEAQLLARLLRKQGDGEDSEARVDAERVLGTMDRIQNSVRRMVSLLETLTDMSKVALGSLDLRIGTVNLEDIVRVALSHCSPDDSERVKVEVVPESVLTGEWDASRLDQVVSNLLGNAFKYSDAGTPVEVTLSSEEDMVTLQVRDYGIGIPAEEINHIFSRYSRANNAREGGVDGLGLGLYLCKGIVEAHGGHIWATSGGRDQGTTFTVRLPRLAYASQELRGLS